jgi:hypothetical protein
MTLKGNLCGPGCAGHKVTVHVAIHGNLDRLGDRELALMGCSGRLLGITIGA